MRWGAERTCIVEIGRGSWTVPQTGHGRLATHTVLQSRSDIGNILPRANLHVPHCCHCRFSVTVAPSGTEDPTSRSLTCIPRFCLPHAPSHNVSFSQALLRPCSETLAARLKLFNDADGNGCSRTQMGEGTHASRSGRRMHGTHHTWQGRRWWEFGAQECAPCRWLLLRLSLMSKWERVGVEPIVPVSKCCSGRDICIYPRSGILR